MNKQELNKCAHRLHEAYLKTGDYSLFESPKYCSSWAALFQAYGVRYFSKADYEDIISDVLMKAISRYEISTGNDFENFFNKCLSNTKKTQQTNDGKKKNRETSLDKTITDPEGRETSVISLTEAEEETYNIEEMFDKREIIHNLYLMGAELALKRPSGKTDGEIGSRDKKAMFYKKLFFTDMLSACRFVLENTEEFFRYNKTKLGNSADINFANSFFVNTCRDVTDFPGNKFRPYSDFTLDPKHEGRPCADLSNFAREHNGKDDTGKDNMKSLGVLYLEVYAVYVTTALGESISKSQLSTRRKDFSAALIEAFKTQYIYEGHL